MRFALGALFSERETQAALVLFCFPCMDNSMTMPLKMVPRSRRAFLVAALVSLSAAGLGAWWWLQPPAPPQFPLEKVDPEIGAAIREAREQVRRNPASASAWGHLGSVLLVNRIFLEEALGCFAEAEKRDAADPRLPFFRGKILADLGRMHEARAPLQRAAELCAQGRESNPAPRLLLAEILLTSEQFDLALAQFDKALEQDPNNPQAQWGLGRLAFAREDWPACKRYLEACLASPNARKKAAAQLAAVCRRLEDEDGAAKFANLAARLPRDVDWLDSFTAEILYLSRRKENRYSLVLWLEASGRYPEAIQALESLAAEYPRDYLPHTMLGVILPKAGKYRAAEDHLRQALEIAPEKFQVHYQLSRVYLGRGDQQKQQQPPDLKEAQHLFHQAEHFARQALAEKPDYGFAHLALGMSLQQLGRTSEALDSFRQAVQCLPENMESHLYLGTALAEAGKVAKGRHHLEEALQLAGPNDPRPKAALEKLTK